MNITHWFDDSLREAGDYTALIAGGVEWTSAMLHDRACRLASSLIRLGLAPGDRVLLLLPTGADVIAACPAVWRAGGVVVLGYAGAPATELDRIAEHCSPRIIIAGPGVSISRAGDDRIIISTASEPPPGMHSYDQLVANAPPLVSPVPRDDRDLAQLTYTSGTTGAAKAVEYTHGGLGAYLSHIRAAWIAEGRPRDVVLLPLPPTAFGGIPLTKRPASCDTLVVVDGSDPGAVWDALERYRITYVAAVPTLIEKWLAAAPAQRARPHLRTVVLTGAAVSPALLERVESVLGLAAVVSYGMTEAGGAIAWSHGHLEPECVGDIESGVEVRILDPHGEPAPSGVEGEVVIRTPWMAAGYFRDAAASAEVFVDGWIHTGDRGHVAGRALYLTGRSKDIIIQGGVNVAPIEIEQVIAQLPAVAEVVVFGAPNAALGEMVVACIVPRAGAQVLERDVLAHCRLHLEARKLPGRIEVVDAIPRTPTGKPKKRELLERIVARATTASAGGHGLREVPPSARADMIRAVAERLLGDLLEGVSGRRDAVELDRPLRDVGLSSIEAVRFALTLGEAIGAPIPATLVFTHPTLSAIIPYLVELVGDRAPRTHRTPRTPRATRHPANGSGDAIAIIGIGCRMPGGVDSPDAMWCLLRDGVDATGRPAADRWPAAQHEPRGAFLEQIDSFDGDFFRLGANAHGIDPQHRLLLEVTWEALERAGVPARRLREYGAGLFVGISGSSYSSPDGLGVAASMAAGRICHFFDLPGPAISIDTSCSSALVALHAAVNSLRAGECGAAIVGGVHVMASPAAFAGLAELGVLAPDGRCRPFDDQAHGFARGEGCIVLVLKRLADAVRDGDAIDAVIRGTAINSDGRSSSLTAPNPSAQIDVIQRALEDAALEPDAIQYVEAHGTGTRLGDPVEVEALASVFAERAGPRLRIGSVKSNVGHLEAGAGLAGVLKVVLAIARDELPASLHVDRPNALIPWASIPIEVQTALGPWPDPARPRIAGVSSFGMSGTNAHVIVEAAPPRREVPSAPSHRGPLLLPVSARTKPALWAQARRMADALEAGALDPRDVAATAARRREHLEQRLVVAGDSTSDWAAQLRAAADRQVAPIDSQLARRGVVFVFSGQGAQWPGMGRDLLDSEPAFRVAFDACARLVEERVSWRVRDELERSEATSRLHETEIAQPLVFCLQIALAALWRSWGVMPSAVVGHSLGEIAAAHVAGALSLEQATQLVVERGRIMQQTSGRGSMLAARLSADAARELLSDVADLEIAADNAPASITLAGPSAAITAAASRLSDGGIRHKALPVRYAFHSAQVGDAARALRDALADLRPGEPRIPMFSTATAAVSPRLDADYWSDQIRQRVRFREASEAALAAGYRTFLEIGPHPVLLDDLDGTFAARAQRTCVVASLRRDQPGATVLRQGFAELHCAGLDVDWSAMYPGAHPVVSLPTYPWERRRYWSEATSSADAARVSPLVTAHVRVFDEDDTHIFTLRPSAPELAGYHEGGAPCMSGAAWLAAAIVAADHGGGLRTLALTDFVFGEPLSLAAAPAEVQLSLRRAPEHDFVVRVSARHDGRSVEHARGRLSDLPSAAVETWDRVAILERCRDEVWFHELYPRERSGLVDRTGGFRAIGSARRNDREVVAELVEPVTVSGALSPAVLDACFHAVALLAGLHRAYGAVPVRVGSVRIYGPGTPAWIYARRDDAGAEVYAVDVRGVALARITGVELGVARADAGSLPEQPAMSRSVDRSAVLERVREHVAAIAQITGQLDDDARLDDLGFDSLLIVTLRRRLAAELGPIPADALRGELRVLEIAEHLSAAAPDPRPSASSMHVLRSNGEAPALVLVHPIGGSVDCYRPLARAWPGPVMAIEAPRRGQLIAVDAIAAHYVELTREARPPGPWVLAGWSFGAVVAHAMACHLQATGDAAPPVVLIDPPPPPPTGDVSGARAVEHFVRDLLGVRRSAVGMEEREISALVEAARHGDPRDHDQRLIAQLVARRVILELSAGDVHAALATFRRHLAALAAHRPGVYSGALLAVRASQSPAADWQAHAPRLALRTLGGDHYSIVGEPVVSELAEFIRDWKDAGTII